jgi:hypothetical protein
MWFAGSGETGIQPAEAFLAPLLEHFCKISGARVWAGWHPAGGLVIRLAGGMKVQRPITDRPQTSGSGLRSRIEKFVDSFLAETALLESNLPHSSPRKIRVLYQGGRVLITDFGRKGCAHRE